MKKVFILLMCAIILSSISATFAAEEQSVDQTVVILTQYISNDPNEANAYYNRAIFYVMKGQYRVLLSTLQQELFNNNPITQLKDKEKDYYDSAIEKLEKKVEQWRKENPNISVKNIKKWCSIDEDDGEDPITYIEVHYVGK